MSGDNKESGVEFSRRDYMRVLGSATVVAAGAAQVGSATEHGYGTSGYGVEPYGEGESGTGDGSDSGTEDESGSGGFSWDQTFTDTSWLYEADANGELNVETVTTLDYSAPGGLGEAVNADGPTVVVFEVGGVIELGSSENFHIRSDQVYVAGETAPSPGISITRGRCRIYGDQVILSHVGVFPGDETDEAVSAIVPDGEDIMVDHCTGMWGTDEVLSASNPVHRSSFINCICAEGLYDSIHAEDTHSRGYFYNEAADECVGLGNLVAHNNRRNPMTRADLVWCNNYVYNHGRHCFNLSGKSDPVVTSISNVYEMGPDSSDFDDRYLYHYGGTLYHEDTDSIPEGRPVSDGGHEMVDQPPIWPSGLDKEEDLVPFDQVRDSVITHAGPRPADRPPVETELINNRLSGSDAGFVDSQDDVGGYPDYDRTVRALDVPSSDIVAWVHGYKEAVEVSA